MQNEEEKMEEARTKLRAAASFLMGTISILASLIPVAALAAMAVSVVGCSIGYLSFKSKKKIMPIVGMAFCIIGFAMAIWTIIVNKGIK